MHDFDHARRHWLASAAALAAAGCAGTLGSSGVAGPALPAPVFRVGDEWVYNCADGYRLPVTWLETHRVVSVGPGGIDVEVTIEGPTMHYRRVEHLLSPGVVASGEVYDNVETRDFVPPLIRYQFPLTPFTSWRQGLRNYDAPTTMMSNIQRQVRVDGYESVAVPAGTFNTLTMYELMGVDDNNPFRFPTNCTYRSWWAAEAGAMVKMTKYATYIERGGGRDATQVRAQNTTMLLETFRYGATR